MQTSKIDIRPDEIEDAIAKIRSAQREFSDFKANLFNDERRALDDMNSDFTNKLSDVLGVIQNQDLDNFEKLLAGYVTMAEKAKDALVAVDKECGQAMLMK